MNASHHPQAAADPIALLVTQIPAERRTVLGLPATLPPEGRELTETLLRPLAEGRGPLTWEKIEAGTAKWREDPAKIAAIMEHRISLLNGHAEQNLGSPIDWFRAPDRDWQWTCHLHYQYWLEPLAYAWHATRDPRYSGELIAILLDWIRSFPLGVSTLTWGVPRSLSPGITATAEGDFPTYWGPWISLQAHSRTDHWTDFFQLIWDAPQMTNATVAVLLNSLITDHRLMMLNFDRQETSNQYIAIANSLIHLGWWYPDFASAPHSEAIGRERIMHFATTQIYPDGSAAECSPNYSVGSLGRLLELLREGEQRGQPFPPELRERVRLGMRYVMLLADPGGRSPRIAKGGGSVRESVARANVSFQDPEAAWFVSRGMAGQAPSALCHLFPWVGHAVMRSGWGEDATWLFFEPGPRGGGHYDWACLNLQLQANGEWLLTDPGYYSYSNVGEDGAMSSYLRTTAAHNLALVDGHCQLASAPGSPRSVPNTAPGIYEWVETAQSVSVSGAYTWGFSSAVNPTYGVWDGQGERIAVIHRREIIFNRKGDLIEIIDTFAGAGQHRIDLHWQCAAQARVSTETGKATVAMPHTRLHMSFKAPAEPDITVHRGERHPYRGWFSETYGELTTAPLVQVALTGELPLRIVTRLRIERMQE